MSKDTTTRRQLLRAGANGAVATGIAALSPIDDVLAAGDEATTITYAYARDDPADLATLRPRTKTVPGDWHRAVSGAFDVHDRLVDADIPGLLGSAVVPGSYDAPMASIAVDVLPDAESVLTGSLAELLDGVDFLSAAVSKVDPSGERRDADGAIEYAPSLTEPDAPGGIPCGHDGALGTLAPALFDADGRSYFATSNHLFGAGDDSVEESLVVFDDEQSERTLGRVQRRYPRQDFVLAWPTGDFNPTNGVAAPGPSTVAGQFTRIGLADLAARGEPLWKVGARTGVTTGPIRGIDGVTCYAGGRCRRGQLRWGGEATFDDGDSGSVNFRPDPERPDECVLVGGLNNARTWWPGQNFTWGTAAYQMTAVNGVRF
ncbi:hypothetical protein SAMN06269185_0026 [Natronoarchaeum philippinense]|uniref:Uncharacterized protein n=1 Tax=Natronoarchaeum philippinense TaxID=558529 RepID=A0A285MZ41_NATPI|nr:hypothetical protein [Natronoarchaeum philippinense]SNZ02455.1 hypothetical protein SAMN06269185_0026 [Natronoarchaeum philippinense]